MCEQLPRLLEADMKTAIGRIEKWYAAAEADFEVHYPEEEESMLKEQRTRLPAFVSNLQKIINQDGMGKLSEILGVTAPTIKKWIKGKEDGGTEPPSFEFAQYEKKINLYIKKEEIQPAELDAKTKSARDTYLDSIRKVNQYCIYFIKQYPDAKAFQERLEGTSRVLLSPNEYEDWNLQMAMIQSSNEFNKALVQEIPELKVVNDKITWHKAQMESLAKASDRKKHSEASKRLSADLEHKKLEIINQAEMHINMKGNDQMQVSKSEPLSESLEQIALTEILPNPYQPRKVFHEEAIAELAASMKKDGLIQPIVVRRTKEGLVLVAGERRMRAAQKLGWTQIKAIVTVMEEAQAAAASIIENFQRVQNNPVEIADAIANMIERTGVTQAEVAKMIGVSQPKVAQIVSLTRLIEPIKDLIAEEKMSPSVGRIIAGLDLDIQERLLSSLADMTAEKAQQFVNCYKGIVEIGSAEESERLEVRMFQRLYRAGYIDSYSSAWNNIKQNGMKTISVKNLKGVYYSYYKFEGPDKLDKLMQRAGLKQTWGNNHSKIVFELVLNKKAQASTLLFEMLHEVVRDMKDEQIAEEGITEEQRAEIGKNRLSHLREKFETLHQESAGTAFVKSIEEAMSDLEGLDDEDVYPDAVEEFLEQAEEQYAALKDMISDSSRARSLTALQAAFDRADAAKSEFADSNFVDAFNNLTSKIAQVLSDQVKYNGWDLMQFAMSFAQEVNDAIDAVKFSLDSVTEEKREGLQEAADSELPVLNQKPEKTKTNRILQILQEQTTDLHEISVKCRDCLNFNPDGSTYADRCTGNPSFHQFKRFSVEGKTAFNCSSYAPKRDVIERKKKEANIDATVALFELMIYKDGYSREYPHLSWIEDHIPELKGQQLSVQQIVERFAKHDDSTRAYWIEVFFRRNMLSEVVYKNKAHPYHTAEGRRFIVENNSIENEDRIV